MKKTVILLGCTMLNTIALGMEGPAPLVELAAPRAAERILEMSTTVADVVTHLNTLAPEMVPLVLPTILQSPKFNEADKNQIILNLLVLPQYALYQREIISNVRLRGVLDQTIANRNVEHLRIVLNLLPLLDPLRFNLVETLHRIIVDAETEWASHLVKEYINKIKVDADNSKRKVDDALTMLLFSILFHNKISDPNLCQVFEENIERIETSGSVAYIILGILLKELSEYYSFVEKKLPLVTNFTGPRLFTAGIHDIVEVILKQKIAQFYGYVKDTLLNLDEFEIDPFIYIRNHVSWIIEHNIVELYGFIKENFSEFLAPEQKEKIENALAAAK